MLKSSARSVRDILSIILGAPRRPGRQMDRRCFSERKKPHVELNGADASDFRRFITLLAQRSLLDRVLFVSFSHGRKWDRMRKCGEAREGGADAARISDPSVWKTYLLIIHRAKLSIKVGAR